MSKERKFDLVKAVVHIDSFKLEIGFLRISDLPHTCVRCSDLPSNLSTMGWMEGIAIVLSV